MQNTNELQKTPSQEPQLPPQRTSGGAIVVLVVALILVLGVG
jgi:hypothetical protein